jgi:hypothetical protein
VRSGGWLRLFGDRTLHDTPDDIAAAMMRSHPDKGEAPGERLTAARQGDDGEAALNMAVGFGGCRA